MIQLKHNNLGDKQRRSWQCTNNQQNRCTRFHSNLSNINCMDHFFKV